jgi:valyl-tRNA synthetase
VVETGVLYALTLQRVFWMACLALLHPFTPFVTEELWQSLKKAAVAAGFKPFAQKTEWEEALILARWPETGQSEGWEEEKIAKFGAIQDLVRANRNLRAEKKIQPSVRTPGKIVSRALHHASSPEEKEVNASWG